MLVILVALIGFGFSVNAQTSQSCVVTFNGIQSGQVQIYAQGNDFYYTNTSDKTVLVDFQWQEKCDFQKCEDNGGWSETKSASAICMPNTTRERVTGAAIYNHPNGNPREVKILPIENPVCRQ